MTTWNCKGNSVLVSYMTILKRKSVILASSYRSVLYMYIPFFIAVLISVSVLSTYVHCTVSGSCDVVKRKFWATNMDVFSWLKSSVVCLKLSSKRCFWIFGMLIAQEHNFAVTKFVTVPVVCITITIYTWNNQIVISHSLLSVGCYVTLQSALKKSCLPYSKSREKSTVETSLYLFEFFFCTRKSLTVICVA